VSHVNVVQMLDVVVQDDEVFIVMDYVRGESLARLWRRLRDHGQRMSLEIACAIAVNTLRGLHAAHEARDEMGRPLAIVHRDVSPQNIIVGADGVVRLIDFGVAKATIRLQTTRDGTLKGKLAYMAPEQVAGGATRLTDIWAAAVVLWECLTGQRLFYEECESKVFTRVLSQRVTPPSEIVRSLPRELDGILLSALSRVPSARFPTAEDMAAAIERVVRVAPPAVVAQWVQAVAGDLLAARDGLISSIECVDEPPRRQEAERVSAIVLKNACEQQIPVVEVDIPSPDTERRPSCFPPTDHGRRDTTLPSAERKTRHTAAVALALFAAVATFLGGFSVIAAVVIHREEIVPSAHAAPPSGIPRQPRNIGARRVNVHPPPFATAIDRPAALRSPLPAANARRSSSPAPAATVALRAAPAPATTSDEPGF
jgi:serine/threonine-protein kinase